MAHAVVSPVGRLSTMGPTSQTGGPGAAGCPRHGVRVWVPGQGPGGTQPEKPRQLVLESGRWSPLTSGGTAATPPLSWCPRLWRTSLPSSFRVLSGACPVLPLWTRVLPPAARREGVCVCGKPAARGVRPRPQCPQAPVQPGAWGAAHPGVSPHKRTGRLGGSAPSARTQALPSQGSASTRVGGSWGAGRVPRQGVGRRCGRSPG